MLKVFQSLRLNHTKTPTSERWSIEDLKLLKHIVTNHKRPINWNTVAIEMKKPPESCKSYYHRSVQIKCISRPFIIHFLEKEKKQELGKLPDNAWRPSELLSICDAPRFRNGNIKWDLVLNQIGGGRSLEECTRVFRLLCSDSPVQNEREMKLKIYDKWAEVFEQAESYHRSRWTADDVKVLGKLKRQDKPWTEISARLGKSESSCVTKYLQFKTDVVPKRPWTSDDLEYLREMAMKRVIDWDLVSSRLDRTKDACIVKWQRIKPTEPIKGGDCRRKRTVWTQDRLNHLANLLREGIPHSEIATQLNATVNSIRVAAYRHLSRSEKKFNHRSD